MRYLFFCLVLSCGLFQGNEDRLEGHFARDPLITFEKHFREYDKRSGTYLRSFKAVSELRVTDTIYVAITEFNRSDGKPCPADAKNLKVCLETRSGDRETLSLEDSPFPHVYDMTPYWARVFYDFNKVRQGDGVLNLNPNGDTVFARYNSYWHGHAARDTLIFQP